jgi:hypothetical protein
MSHMDAPTVPMTGLAPQRIACCGVLRFAAGSLPPDFHQHPSRGHLSLIPEIHEFTEPRGMVPDSSVPDALSREDASGAS